MDEELEEGYLEAVAANLVAYSPFKLPERVGGSRPPPPDGCFFLIDDVGWGLLIDSNLDDLLLIDSCGALPDRNTTQLPSAPLPLQPDDVFAISQGGTLDALQVPLSQLPASYTPSNYPALSSTVAGNLGGIDTELGLSTGSVRIAGAPTVPATVNVPATGATAQVAFTTAQTFQKGDVVIGASPDFAILPSTEGIYAIDINFEVDAGAGAAQNYIFSIAKNNNPILSAQALISCGNSLLENGRLTFIDQVSSPLTDGYVLFCSLETPGTATTLTFQSFSFSVIRLTT